MLLARVAVPVPLGQVFTYSVPDSVAPGAARGARVLCDFGRRKVLGVVLEVSDGEPDVPREKLKPLRAVVGDEPVIPEELLSFLLELARYYVAPIGEVMRLALPAVERSTLDALGREGLLDKMKVKKAGGRRVQVARAVAGATVAKPPRGQAAQVIEHLREHGPTPLSDLTKRWGNARAAVRRLVAEGVAMVEEQEAAADPFFASPAERDTPPELTGAQARAVERVVAKIDAREAGGFLLHGVTASGKTEVYLRAVGHCLADGGGAIVLVPEIALTPQLVSRFRARLGDAIAVLHSGLSDSERHRMWKRLRSGELRVAVGARSALFAPVADLRLVCVDEEHDHSFKQEEGVRYHARDMALLRAHRAGAVCVLGSATPSVETVSLGKRRRLERLELPERARKSAALPRVEIVDLRRTGPGAGDERLLSLPLCRALERVLAAKEQAILFLNRRGFAPSIVCDDCGTLAECPSCSVALTYHRGRHALRCHYCDHSVPFNGRCGRCGSQHIAQEGAGTERIERALAESFPGARIARLDRDVAAGMKSEKVLDRVRRGEVDILVGTQMVTKGHDLPTVTLVGVLNADAALSMPDFRAAERTFHLLVQVAGRAGRGDTPGTVMIQTRTPEHPAIVLAARHDVSAFIERELADRKELGYPPYSRLVLVRVDSLVEDVALSEATRLARIAAEAAEPGVDVLGPAPAPLVRLRNRWRMRFLLRARERKLMRGALLAVVRQSVDRRVRVAVDVDPVSML